MLEPGKYIGKAVEGSWEFGESKNGTPFVQLTLQLDVGDTITWRGFLSDRAAPRTLESLRHMGWHGNDIADIRALPRKVEVDVEHDEWEGKSYARVKWINRIGGPAVKKALDDAAMRALSASLRETAKALPEVQAEETSSFDEDDIPF